MRHILFTFLFLLLPYFAVAEERKHYPAPFGTSVYSQTIHDYQILYIDTNFSFQSYLHIIMLIEEIKPDYINIKSYGGLVEPAINLGQFIKDKNIPVEITKHCISACALLVTQLEHVFIREDGFLAFHTPYIPSIPTDITITEYSKILTLGVIRIYENMRENGYGRDFFELMVKNTNQTTYLVAFTTKQLYNSKESGIGLNHMTNDEIKLLIK